MTKKPLAAAFLAAAFLITGTAAAQESPSISLKPPDLARWDIAAHVGWLHKDTSEIGTDNASQFATFGDDWRGVPATGITAGGYLTPHVKTELQAAVSGEARVYRTEQFLLPGSPPVFRSREHSVQTATLGLGVSYQFFENQWFHPFAGGGVEVQRIRDRVEVLSQSISRSVPPPTTGVSYTARPFIGTGFKWYISERAFVRTAVQVSFSGRGTSDVAWTAGIGGDL